MPTDTVTVACKLPNGLTLSPYDAPTDKDGNAIPGRVGSPYRDQITLNGSNHPSAQGAGGYGLTPGVNKEHFEHFLETHKDMAAVRDGLIYAEGNVQRASARGTEQAELKTGFEGLNPEKPGDAIGAGAKLTKNEEK